MANSRAYLKRIAGASNNTETGAEAERFGYRPFITVMHMADFGLNADSYSDERSHIFDGETAHRNIGNYQLCDITDPFLQEVIQNTEFVRDACDVSPRQWASLRFC
jgi:hypothetical protein